MNVSMSSPPKRPRRLHHTATHRSSESDLPLHLALAYLIVRAHPVGGEGTPVNVYSHGFVGSILQLVASEIYEVGPIAKPFDSLKREVDGLVQVECASIARLNDKVRSRGQAVSQDRDNAERFESWLDSFGQHFGDVADGCAFLDSLEKDIRTRLNEDEEEDLTELPEPIERRSPFGLFLRGLLLTLRKLSFDETAQLSHQIASWCGVAAGPSRTGSHLWSLNRKLAMEETLDKRSDAISEYQKATESADYSKALTSLRRFYDYQFPSSGRGQHQHALLNLAMFHFSQGGLSSAKAAVDEAIRVARAENDRACLKQCMSLLHRLQTETTTCAFLPAETPRIHQQPVAAGRLPKPETPMDDLWSIKAALDMGEPTHVAIRRVHLALARQEELLARSEGKKDSKQGTKGYRPFPVAPWHATQAGLWSLLGCEELARMHEDLALENAAGDADTRLTVLLQRSERSVHAGRYSEALAMLVDYQAVDQMTISTYHRWVRHVWSILEHQAALSDDQEALDIVYALKPPDQLSVRLGPGGNTRELGQPLSMSGMEDPALRGIPLAHEEIRASLRKARKMQDANAPPHSIISHVLSAVQLASELGLWPVYRTGIILLAEVMLSMEGQGLARKAIDEVQSIWDQVVAENDQENIARGALVVAKGNIDVLLDAHGGQDGKEALIRTAEDKLKQALNSAERVGSHRLKVQCTTLLALLSELRGISDEEMVDKWYDASTGNVIEQSGLRDEIRKVGEIVKLVGVRVAEHWA